ncbi:MAG: POTRA domain-containing protein [Bacteroidota bacterium]|nr:POTRA domain-containing protein [Bacteroidota bacterium]
MIEKKLKSKRHVFILLVLVALISGVSKNAAAQITIGDNLEEVDYAEPKTYTIGGITVSGIQFLDKNVLVMLSGLTVGEEIDIPGEKVSTAIKKLWKQGLFENIRIYATKIQGNTIFLDIAMQERSRLSEFSFKGVKKSEANKLRDELGLVRGDVVTDNMRISSKNKIVNYFAEKGYLNAEVYIIQNIDTARANSVNLRFNIDKNRKIKIKNINVYGNSEFSDVKVKKAFKETKEKSRFRPINGLGKLLVTTATGLAHLDFVGIVDSARSVLADDYRLSIFKSSKYIKDLYEDDKQLVVDKYNTKGYRDFKIYADSIVRNDDNTIDINLYVDEGQKYFFRDVKWVGNTVYTAEQLDAVLGIRNGDVFNQEILDTKLNYDQTGMDISSLYLDNGYLFFYVTPVEVNIDGDSIDMEMRLYEGKQATISKVTVSGNTRTHDHVVLREIRTKPGQLFSRQDIIRTTRELAQLKYFNAETITPIPIPNQVDGTVDIEYQVEETSSDQVELSGGWGYGRLIGTLGLSFNNFSTRNFFKPGAWRPVPSGDGQKVSLRFQSYGKGYLSYSASFTEPWLGGKKPNALTVSYYHSMYGNSYTTGTSDYSFRIDGLSVGLGKRLKWPDDYFVLRQTLGYQRYKLDNYTQIFNFGDGNGTYNTISYEISFGRNSVDAPIFPRKGSNVSLSLEVTPPYSVFTDKDYSTLSDKEKFNWMEFHKWKFKGTWFKSIVGDLVLNFRTQYGFLGSYNNDIGTIPFNRYFLGGDGLSGYSNFDGREIIAMRGYSNYSLTPGYYQDTKTGASLYNKSTIELRFPISLNPSATVYALGFLEAGNAWSKFSKFEPFNLYRSAGVGLRVFLPMFGLLGIDYGYGFDDVPGMEDANKGQFHFSIGQSLD